jgi:hypothetical protein
MRRAVLMLATFGLALTGCYSRHYDQPAACAPVGTLTVYWQVPQGGFVSPAGALQACDAAGVAYVDVSVNGVSTGKHPCHGPRADGIQLTGFTDETVKVQADAYDAQGNLLFQDVRNVTTAYCYDTTVDVQLAAVAAPLLVSYALPVPTCPANSFVWLSLVDVTGNVQYDLVDLNNTPNDLPCGVQNPIVYPKALYGQYRLDFMQVVQWNGSSYESRYQYCAPTTFNHVAPNDQLSVTLQPTVGVCR